MSSKTIDFADFGSDFVTRHQGARAREWLEKGLSSYPDEERVTVSLSGVGTMAPSFADECFGKLLQSLGAARFRARIAFVGADETTKALLNAVLSRRAEVASKGN